MLTPRGHLQAGMKLVHQPGFAATDWPPEINTFRRFAALQGFKAELKLSCSLQLRRVTDKTLRVDSLLVQLQRGRFGEAGHEQRLWQKALF
ncbi:hypothetical protein D3C72_1816090 [compost metagenome]